MRVFTVSAILTTYVNQSYFRTKYHSLPTKIKSVWIFYQKNFIQTGNRSTYDGSREKILSKLGHYSWKY